jgi:hypothetical protein
MITVTECLVRARDARIAAFRLISDRERRFRGYWVGADPYPGWARDMDRQAGALFARANQYQALAEGPFWKRWFR